MSVVTEQYKQDLARFSQAGEYTLRHFVAHALEASDIERPVRLICRNPAWIEVHRDFFAANDIDSDVLLFNDINAISSFLIDNSVSDVIAKSVQIHTVRHLVSRRTSAFEPRDLATLTSIGKVRTALNIANKESEPVRRCASFRAIVHGLPVSDSAIDSEIVTKLLSAFETVTDPIECALQAISIIPILIKLNRIDSAQTCFQSAIQKLDDMEGFSVKEIRTNYGRVQMGVEGRQIEAHKLVDRLTHLSTPDKLKKNLLQIMIDCDQIQNVSRSIPSIEAQHVQVNLWLQLADIYKRKEQFEQHATVLVKVRQGIHLLEPVQRAWILINLSILEPDLEFISQSLDTTINEICEEIDDFIDARQEIMGRSEGMDNINSVFYAENLCELIFQFFSANLHQHIDRITDKIYTLIKSIKPVGYFNNEEQPIVYIEEHIGGRRVDSIPHFGRADDIRCLLAQTFDRIDDEAKALEVRLEISNEVVKTLSTYKRLKYLCDRGRMTEAEDLLPTLLPLTLVFLHDQNKIRLMTRFNHEIFDVSPISLRSLAVQKVAHTMFSNDLFERGRDLLIAHIENVQSASARMQFYSFLANLLAKARHHTDAHRYLDRIVSEKLIETSQSQSFALIELLQLLIQNRLAEPWEHLEQLTNTIKIEALRQDGLRMLAEYLLTLDNRVHVERGLQILENQLEANHDNTDQYMKCVSYGIIGKAFHRSGHTTRARECILFALQAIDKMEDGLKKADVVRTVAESMFHISDDHFVDNVFDLAIQQSQKAFPRWNQIPILAFIAESLFRTGRTDWMKHVVSAAVHELRLRYPQAHGAIGSELINSLLKIGEFDLSVSIASSLRDDTRNLSLYNSVLQKIILELCRTGRFSDAANLQMMLTHPIKAAESLINFAVLLNEAQDKSRALSVLDRAEDLVTQIDDGSEEKDQLLASMAVAEARIRSFDKIQNTISSIRSRDQQDIARSRIADFLMAKHEYLQALALLNEDNLDDLIRHFVMWQHEFEKGHAGESIGLLAEMIRITSWYREDWNVVHEILRRMQNVVR